MRRVIICVIAFFVVLIGAAIAVPNFIDWNKYKPELTQRISQASGYTVALNGNLSLSLLPTPVMTVNNIALSQANDILMDAQSMEVSVDLFPLFMGNINVNRIDIVSPNVFISRDNQGHINWQSSANKKPDTNNIDPIGDSSQSSADIAFDAISIKQGNFFFEDKKIGLIKELINTDINITAPTLYGPFTVSGSTTYNSQKFGFTAFCEELISGKPSSFETSITHATSNGILHVNGNFSRSPSLQLSGTIDSSTDNAIAFLSALTVPEQVNALFDTSSLKASSSFSILNNNIALSNIAINSVQTDINGNIEWKPETADNGASLTANINSKKLTWNTPIVKTIAISDTKKKEAPEEENDLFKLIKKYHALYTETMTRVSDKFIPITVKVGINSLHLNKRTFNDIAIFIEPENKLYKIKEFRATLPASSVLSADGAIDSNTKEFKGAITVKSQQANKLLQAYAIDNSLDSDNLDVTAKINLSPEAVSLSSLDINNGNGKVVGSLSYTKDKDVPFTLSLKADNLSINNILAEQKKKTTEQTADTVLSENSGNTSLMHQLATTKMQIKLFATNTSLNKQPIKSIEFQGVLNNLGLDINNFNISKDEYTRLTTSGYIKNIATVDGMDIDALFQSSKVSSFIPIFFPNYTGTHLASASVKMSLIGSLDDLMIDFGGPINDVAMRLHGSIKDINKTPEFDLKASANHTETSRMIESLLGYIPNGVGIGRFFIETPVKGTLSSITMPDIFLQIGSSKTQGKLTYQKTSNNKNSFNIGLTSNIINISELMPKQQSNTPDLKQGTTHSTTNSKDRWSSTPINLDALHAVNGNLSLQANSIIYGGFTFTNPNVSVTLNEGVIVLNSVKSNLFNGLASVTGQFTAGTKNAPHAGVFDIAVKNANVGKFFEALGQKTFANGVLNYNQKLTFNGLSQKAIISSLSGNGQMDVSDAILNGMDLNKLSQNLEDPNSLSDFATLFDTLTQGGTTPFDTVTAPITIRNGIVSSDNVAMTSDEVTVALKGQADLPNWAINANGVVNFVKRRNIPPLSLTVYGTLDNPQKRFDKDIVSKFIRNKATSAIGKKISESLFGKQEKATTSKVVTPTAPVVEPVTPQQPAATGTKQQAKPAPSQEQQLKDVGQQLLNNFLGGKF